MNNVRSRYTAHLRTRILLCICCVLAASISAALPAAGQSALQQNVYLPLIAGDIVLPQPSPTPGPSPTPQPTPPATVFGMVMSSITPDRGFDSLRAAGVTWIRSNNNLLWRDVEPIEAGGYQWN